MEITEPLIISKGSHVAGTGEGCIMNVISWENGDKIITDFPPCTARPLARLMQMYNDAICTHTGSQRLCAPCALKTIDLGHQTVGTAGQPREKVNEWLQACLALIPTGRHAGHVAAAAAYADAAAAHAGHAAAYADAYAAAAAAYADAAAAYAYADAAAAYADAYAAAADAYAAAAVAKLEFIEKAVPLWHSVCGTTPIPVNVESLNTALRAMAEVH